jgi:hypothetical protein
VFSTTPPESAQLLPPPPLSTHNKTEASVNLIAPCLLAQSPSPVGLAMEQPTPQQPPAASFSSPWSSSSPHPPSGAAGTPTPPAPHLHWSQNPHCPISHLRRLKRVFCPPPAEGAPAIDNRSLAAALASLRHVPEQQHSASASDGSTESSTDSSGSGSGWPHHHHPGHSPWHHGRVPHFMSSMSAADRFSAFVAKIGGGQQWQRGSVYTPPLQPAPGGMSFIPAPALQLSANTSPSLSPSSTPPLSHDALMRSQSDTHRLNHSYSPAPARSQPLLAPPSLAYAVMSREDGSAPSALTRASTGPSRTQRSAEDEDDADTRSRSHPTVDVSTPASGSASALTSPVAGQQNGH